MEVLAKEKVRTAWQSDTDKPIIVPNKSEFSIAENFYNVKRVSPLRQKTKLRCPFCDSELIREYTDETCSMCGHTMVEWKECKCCGEYSIPGTVAADYCENCKQGVKKKLFDFLDSNYTETELEVLDDVVDESFYWFMRGYKEEHGIE